jgi:hypothetical protein
MRLKIGKAGKYLHLRRGTAIQLDMQSPVWFGDRNPESLPGIKSYSFTVPNDSYNRLLLGRPDLLDNPADFLSEDGWQIYYDNWLLFEGKLEVEDTQKDEDFRVTFIGGLAGNLNALKETYLTEMLADDVREFSNILLHAKEVLDAPNDFDYRFPTIKTWEDTAEDEQGLPTRYEYINYYHDASDAYVRSFEEDQVGGGTKTIYCSLSPQLRVKFLLEKCFELASYSMNGVFNTYKDALELSRLILFNNFTKDDTNALSEPTWADIFLSNTIRLANHVPQNLLASDFVKRICAGFGWSMFRSEEQRTVTIKPWKELLNAPYIDWTKKVDPRFLRSKQVEDIPTRYEYDHIGEDSYPERFKLRLQNRQVDFYFSNYEEAKSTLQESDAGAVCYIESVNHYLEFGLFIAGDPAFKNLGKSLGVINENDIKTYDVSIDTLHTVTPFEAGIDYIPRPFGPEKVPAFYGSLVTPWGEASGDAFEDELVLLYDRGKQQAPDLNGFYAAASNNNYVAIDIIPVGNLSLIWTGQYGMYNTWHKDWNKALQRMRPVSYGTRLTAADIARLDFSKKVLIDKHLYFLKRVQLTLTTDEIKPASIEYMQIN